MSLATIILGRSGSEDEQSSTDKQVGGHLSTKSHSPVVSSCVKCIGVKLGKQNIFHFEQDYEENVNLNRKKAEFFLVWKAIQ